MHFLEILRKLSFPVEIESFSKRYANAIKRQNTTSKHIQDVLHETLLRDSIIGELRALVNARLRCPRAPSSFQ
jgi:hypothetical protein